MKKYLKKNSSKHGLTFFLLFAEQWSPINTEGKKQYGRDFLLKLANDPLSKQKPCNMPPMDIIKDKPNADKAKFPLPTGPMSKDWTPSFIKSTTSKVYILSLLLLNSTDKISCKVYRKPTFVKV